MNDQNSQETPSAISTIKSPLEITGALRSRKVCQEIQERLSKIIRESDINAALEEGINMFSSFHTNEKLACVKNTINEWMMNTISHYLHDCKKKLPDPAVVQSIRTAINHGQHIDQQLASALTIELERCITKLDTDNLVVTQE